MYYVKKNVKVSKLTQGKHIDLNRIKICEDKYPNVFALTAAAGNKQDGYPEYTQTDKNRHIIYSLGPRGKSLLASLSGCKHYNDTLLYQVSAFVFLSFIFSFLKKCQHVEFHN